MLLRLFITTLLLAPLSVMAAEPISAYQLQVRDGSNRLIDHFTIQQQQWCLHWNHSVVGIAVQDCFRVDNDRLILDHSWQPDFAAGLGHFEGRGTFSEHPQGGYLIRDINEPVANNTLLLRVGSPAVAHTLVSGEDHMNLSEIAAGQRIYLQLKPLQLSE